MSKEIRRLHRKQKPFTNFSTSQPTEPNQHDFTDTATEPSRRQRRRGQNDSESDTSYISSLTNPPQSKEEQIDDDSQTTPTSSSPVINNNINSIRAEFQEDNYHQELSQSDFSDDTHDWGSDSVLLSADYWHFLGSFE